MAGLTIDDPIGLKRCFQSNHIIPGDVIYLRAGLYSGDFISQFSGLSGSPITIQSYPGETAIIDGSCFIEGSYTTIKNIVFRYSGWNSRTTEILGSEPIDMPFNKSLTFLGNYNKLINCVLHNLAGFYPYNLHGTEIYGNLMYNFGWSGPDRGHVHGIYTSNDGVTQILIENNILFQNFATGIKLYGTQATLDNYDAVGNTVFNNGILYDRGIGEFGAHANWNLLAGDVTNFGYRIQWRNNLTYHSKDDTGNSNGQNCLSWGTYGLDHPTITGNYLCGREVNMRGTLEGPMVSPTYSGNIHVGPAPHLKALYEAGNTWLDWPGTDLAIYVNPNVYATDRANVTIYNWPSASSVQVDLTTVTGLSAGNQVKVHNVQDYFVDIQLLSLDSNKMINIDMQAINRTVETPYAWATPVSTFPIFGSFVVEKV